MTIPRHAPARPNPQQPGYEYQACLREALVEVVRKLDPKFRADRKDYTVYALFNRPTYLENLALATQLVKRVSRLPGMIASVVDAREEHAFQFQGPGVQMSVGVQHDSVDVYLALAPAAKPR